jgi:hypothetical protein
MTSEGGGEHTVNTGFSDYSSFGYYQIKGKVENHKTDGEQDLKASIEIKASKKTLCTGGNVDFSIKSQLHQGTGPTYKWFVNGEKKGTGITYSSSLFKTGDKIKVELTSNAPGVTAKAMSNVIKLVVNTRVKPSAVIASSSKEICAGESVVYSVKSVKNGGKKPRYNWWFNDKWQQTSLTYKPVGLKNGDVVKMRLASSLSCFTKPKVYSNSITTKVNPNVKPSVKIAASSTTIKSGQAVNFSIKSQTHEGNQPSYKWLVNGVPKGTGLTYSSTLLKDGDKVRVKLSSNANCAIPSQVTSSGISIKVTKTINKKPTVSLVASSKDVTEGSSITFTFSGADSDGTITSTVLKLDGQVKTWTSPKKIKLKVGTHNISVTVTDNKGATATKTVTVTVQNSCTEPAWSATTTYTWNDKISYNGYIWIAKAWSEGSKYEPGNVASGLWNPWKKLTPCGNSARVAKLKENIAEAKSYPNPSSGQFTLQLGGTTSADVKIINSQGELVLERKGVSGDVEFDLSTQASGIYLIHIQNEADLKTIRITIE